MNVFFYSVGLVTRGWSVSFTWENTEVKGLFLESTYWKDKKDQTTGWSQSAIP